MSVEWFNKRVGGQVHENVEDGRTFIVGDVVPDWVRLPDDLGGARVRVLGHTQDPCPAEGCGGPVRHLELEDALGVAECPFHGFLWYRRNGV